MEPFYDRVCRRGLRQVGLIGRVYEKNTPPPPENREPGLYGLRGSFRASRSSRRVSAPLLLR